MKKIHLYLCCIVLLMFGVPQTGKAQPDSLVYTVADRLKYFRGRLRGYKEDIDEGLTKGMVATFVVTQKGKLKDVQLVRGAGSKIGADFVQLIKKMPRWKPALLRGKAVAFRYTLPLLIHFQY
jgi:hypothetical protein